MQKCHSDTVVSCTTGGESSVPSKDTPMSRQPALPLSLRRCPYCHQLGSSTHIASCGRTTVDCPDCGEAVEAARMAAHAAYTCSERNAAAGCAGCGGVFANVDMREHLAVCRGSRFPCAGCQQTFLTAAEYVVHVYSPHGNCRRLARGVRPVARREAAAAGGGGEDFLLVAGGGRAPLRAQQPLQIGCGQAAPAVNVDPAECAATTAADDKYQSRAVARAADKQNSPLRHLSKFLRHPDEPASQNRKSTHDSNNNNNNNTVRKSHNVDPTPAEQQNSPQDDVPSVLKKCSTSASGVYLHTRSRRFLKELQERQGLSTGPKQRYRSSTITRAPRLATAELQARRMQNNNNNNNEMPREKLALHDIQCLKKLSKPPHNDNTPRAKYYGRHGMRRHMSCPPRHTPSGNNPPATASRIKVAFAHTNSEPLSGSSRHSPRTLHVHKEQHSARCRQAGAELRLGTGDAAVAR